MNRVMSHDSTAAQSLISHAPLPYHSKASKRPGSGFPPCDFDWISFANSQTEESLSIADSSMPPI